MYINNTTNPLINKITFFLNKLVNYNKKKIEKKKINQIIKIPGQPAEKSKNHMEVKTAEPVYIISDEEESEEDNSGVRESESQSESQLDSDYFEKPTFAHRKSVSFDLSGDERGRSEHERSHTPESSSQYYDSEQEFSSKKLPRKGILRASSPSSSNTSTLETKTTTLEKSLPIMSTVARIKELDSPVHYSRSPSPARSRSRSPPPAQITEKVPEVPQEIEQENPFRAAFLDKTKKDDYTEMAKVISRSPNLLKNARQQFFSSKSSDNLQQEVVTKEHENMSKSVEKLNTGDRPKVKPPPPPKPKNIKKANILQNLALDTFQKTDMGQADYTVYEHDAAANVIHEVGSRSTTPVSNTPTTNIPSPKLPVRILSRTISRPRESPPLPPVNFETLPQKKEEGQVEYLDILPPPPLNIKPAEAHEENSTDKILLTEEEHRDLMLSENELRNQLKENIYDETPPLPQRAIISKHSVNEFSSSNDTLDSWPIMHKKNHLKITDNFHNINNNGLSLSTNFINSIAANTNNAITNNMQPLQLDATAAAPFLATQIFPSAQILPVQYTHLPQLQQSYTNISNLSLGSYVLVPQAQFPIPNATSQQLTQHPLRQQQLVSDKNKQSKATTTPISPSYTTMQFPAFSEIRTPNTFHFPPLPPTPDEIETNNNNYENTALRVSNDTITSSNFSINSSMNSLTKNVNSAVYYETAEQIYSTIKEDAIYSNTSFFDSRRSSDTSLNRVSLTSQTLPPPLPPKKPGGLMPAKYISKSQPDLDQVMNSNPIQQQKLKVVGKETTV